MVEISVVTVCLNAVDGLRSTSLSLMEQSFESFEWVVIDGGSTDGTIAFLNDFPDLRLRFISEPDGGIYDAMNKGLAMAAGRWVIFLGAGDTLYSSDTLTACSDRLHHAPKDCSFAYGGVSYSGTRTRVMYWNSEKTRHFEDLTFSVPSHSSIFFRLSMLQRHFDPSFRILGDRLFMLQNSDGKFYPIRIPITVMLEGGVSYGSRNRWRKRLELIRICKICQPRPNFTHYVRVFAVWSRDDVKQLLLFFLKFNTTVRSILKNSNSYW